MRKYYVFNVNKELTTLTKDSPYMLYKSFESIYKANKKDLVLAQKLYDGLANRINQKNINDKIYADNKNNHFYYVVNNSHHYYNKYKSYEEIVTVKNTFLSVESSADKLILLKSLKNYNLFVCDFENKDYFWLDEVYA